LSVIANMLIATSQFERESNPISSTSDGLDLSEWIKVVITRFAQIPLQMLSFVSILSAVWMQKLWSVSQQ